MILPVADPSQTASARRVATEFAKLQGFDEMGMGRVAIVATEMATNLLKHATSGEILIDRFADSSGTGIELLSLDKGQGIADIPRALQDGFTTGSSPGTGLGAIRRQADHFDIFSRPGLGTAIVARICLTRAPVYPGALVIGGVLVPFPGETHCGDAWAFELSPRGASLFAVDGSGHGLQAENAAKIAVSAFRERADKDGVVLIDAVHRALLSTRGGAVAIARVDESAGLVRFVGVGNIAGSIVSGGIMQRMVSHNGTAGHVAPRIREFTYAYRRDLVVMLHSDGLSSRWDLGTYPGLSALHPSLIAGILFRDHRRARDDASIVVMRV